jgi:hypothetical protein
MTLNELKCKDELDFSILSERLLLKRTDRPDEWSMDELARMALEVEQRAQRAEALLAKARPLLESFAYGRTVGDMESEKIAKQILKELKR